MCNLYSVMTNQDAIRRFVLQLDDRTGNLPQFPGVFPDKTAPIVRNHEGVRELAIARWGMPTPPKYLFTKTGKPRASDPGVTNIRNVKSAH
jgi:putative SOS response-associated peptidase YedK